MLRLSRYYTSVILAGGTTEGLTLKPVSYSNNSTLTHPSPIYFIIVVPSSSWRRAGLSYLQYINVASAALRNCLKEPLKTQVILMMMTILYGEYSPLEYIILIIIPCILYTG